MKFIKRDMLFPTKPTSLVYTRELIDSALQENHRNNRCSSVSHKWSKPFLGGVYSCPLSGDEWLSLDITETTISCAYFIAFTFNAGPSGCIWYCCSKLYFGYFNKKLYHCMCTLISFKWCLIVFIFIYVGLFLAEIGAHPFHSHVDMISFS